MAELTISSDEIRGALERYVSSYTPEISREEVGVVSDAGDGIAHVEGLPSTMANELLEFEDGTLGVSLNLDVREIGVVVLGDFAGIEEGQQVKRTGRVLSVPVGDEFLGRVVDPLGEPIDGLGEIENEGFRELELQAPNVMARQPVKEALQTGIKAIDAMTAIGRGQRQLIIGDRKTGKTTVAIDTILNQRDNWESGDPSQAGALHLRGDRPEGLHHRLGAGARWRSAARWSTPPSSPRPASDPAGFKYLAPVHRLGHRPALDVRRQARADRLRRPEQAGRGVPRGVAAAAPPAGPRGLPGRRLLPALPAAGALREALRRAGRRLDDRPADHRDEGRRHLGVHPDQRHLDHRRPDLPRGGPVQPGRAAGHQRRYLGVPGRRRRPGQADEEGRRPAAAGPGPVPRAGGVRRVRLRPGPGLARTSWTGAPAWSSCSSSPTTRRTRWRSRSSRSGPAPRASSTTSRSATSAGSRPSSCSTCGTRTQATARPRSRANDWNDDIVAALDEAIADFKQMFLGARRRDRRSTRPRPRRWRRASRRSEKVTRVSVAAAGEEASHGRLRYASFVGGSARPARRRRSPRRWSSSRRAASPRRRSGSRRRCRTPTAITGGAHRAGQQRQHRPPAAAGRGRAVAAGRRAADHQRPRPVRRLQRQRHPHRRAAHLAAARRRQAGRCCTSSAARAWRTTGSGNRPIEASWTGFSEQPTFADAREVGETLIAGVRGRRGRRGRRRTAHPGADGVLGVDELHIVHTQFRSLMTQAPVGEPARADAGRGDRGGRARGLLPAYEFEPDAGGAARRAAAEVHQHARSTRRCSTRRRASRRPGGGP